MWWPIPHPNTTFFYPNPLPQSLLYYLSFRLTRQVYNFTKIWYYIYNEKETIFAPKPTYFNFNFKISIQNQKSIQKMKWKFHFKNLILKQIKTVVLVVLFFYTGRKGTYRVKKISHFVGLTHIFLCFFGQERWRDLNNFLFKLEKNYDL